MVDLEKDYPEIKSYCEKLEKEVPNYMKANGDGATKFGSFGGENLKKAVEKVKAQKKYRSLKQIMYG